MKKQQESHSNICETCGGVGYVSYDVPIDDPRFGRIYPCMDCNSIAMYKMAGLTVEEGQLRVADLVTEGRPDTVAMINAAMEFYENGMTGFLSLCGGYGVGKTHVMKAIAAEGIRRGWWKETLYITMTELLMYIREAYSSQIKGDSDLERIRELKRYRLLLIDEFEKAPLTEFAMSIMTELLGERYRYSETLGTILGWNGGFDVIETSMPWVASRLREFIIATNNDGDFRLVLHEVKRSKK